VAALEDVLAVYVRPRDPRRPLVCVDEASKQLVKETRPLQPARPGQPARYAVEYERAGVRNLFLATAPLEGWRGVEVTEQRTRTDWAAFMRTVADVIFPEAETIVVVQDTLNTHGPASFYEAYPPAEARRLVERFEFHYTPKHGSWLNMAESEISIMSRQCLDCRLDCQTKVVNAVVPWQTKRNQKGVRVHWTLTLAAARRKLRKLYPTIEG